MFHLPDIRHSFGEQSIGYCLIKQLNAEEGPLTTDMVLTESFLIYKVHRSLNVLSIPGWEWSGSSHYLQNALMVMRLTQPLTAKS